ncbi:MAG: hydroxyethylthiazole kinase [Desulforegulaceae bacterium]|nr:hydroxyethylthiazole kinase [Desulforegulaceae bacterium]
MNPNKRTSVFHELIKKKSPLIHNITNYVAMNSSANILLACGASPVMAHAIEEVEEMASHADSIVLNLGTLSEKWIKAMILAGKTANKNNIPVILDPVGSGATKFRTETAKKILNEVDISVLRGNISEIFSLSNENIKTRGVDSAINEISDEIIESAKEISIKNQTVVAISGKKDLVTNGKEILLIENGVPLMTKVTGMGCGLSAVIGAFCSVSKKDLIKAAACGFAYYGLCGELAYSVSKNPGTFSMNFIDSLHSIRKEQIDKNSKIKPING